MPYRIVSYCSYVYSVANGLLLTTFTRTHVTYVSIDISSYAQLQTFT